MIAKAVTCGAWCGKSISKSEPLLPFHSACSRSADLVGVPFGVLASAGTLMHVPTPTAPMDPALARAAADATATAASLSMVPLAPNPHRARDVFGEEGEAEARAPASASELMPVQCVDPLGARNSAGALPVMWVGMAAADTAAIAVVAATSTAATCNVSGLSANSDLSNAKIVPKHTIHVGTSLSSAAGACAEEERAR
jgi:hypothetical protein